MGRRQYGAWEGGASPSPTAATTPTHQKPGPWCLPCPAAAAAQGWRSLPWCRAAPQQQPTRRTWHQHQQQQWCRAQRRCRPAAAAAAATDAGSGGAQYGHRQPTTAWVASCCSWCRVGVGGVWEQPCQPTWHPSSSSSHGSAWGWRDGRGQPLVLWAEAVTGVTRPVTHGQPRGCYCPVQPPAGPATPPAGRHWCHHCCCGCSCSGCVSSTPCSIHSSSSRGLVLPARHLLPQPCRRQWRRRGVHGTRVTPCVTPAPAGDAGGVRGCHSRCWVPPAWHVPPAPWGPCGQQQPPWWGAWSQLSSSVPRGRRCGSIQQCTLLPRWPARAAAPHLGAAAATGPGSGRGSSGSSSRWWWWWWRCLWAAAAAYLRQSSRRFGAGDGGVWTAPHHNCHHQQRWHSQ
jgi:hypothetical protein